MAVFLAAFLISCGKDDGGEPAQWLLYFTFVNNEGHDFFESANEDYSSDSVFMLENGNTVSFDDMQANNNQHVYGWGTWGASTASQRAVFYISFGNGDIDTLTYEWKPSSVQSVSSDSFDELSELLFYYNGSLIEEWDLEANPDLEQQLINRNTPRHPATSADDPIVIALPKNPDPEEID